MANSDEITEWLARQGRNALNLEAAKQLAAESPGQWYVASCGTRGYLVGKMTLQKYSARHILVDESGEAVLFPTIEGALAFLRSELKVPSPHVFNY
jgi:sarcosine oxidase gamma subunit